MSDSSAPSDARRRSERGPLRTAVLGGLLTFAALAALGQVAAFAVFAATGRYRAWSWLKIGLVYLMSFCGIRVEATTTTLNVYEVRASLMTGTALGLWLLFRAGRSASVRARSLTPGRGAAWGVPVAVVFGAAVGCSSLLIKLRFPEDGIELLRPVVWEAFVISLTIGLGAAMLGGAWVPMAARAAGVARSLEGALRTFLVALVLAWIGLFVIGALGPDASIAYGRGIRASGEWGGVLIGHQVLAIPDQALGLLAPAMGGATELWTASGDVSRVTLDGIGVGETMRVVWPLPEVPPGGMVTFPAWYASLLIVPALAGWVGGRWAGYGAGGRWVALARGAGAGAGSGALVWIASWFATLTVEGASGTSSLGPALPQAGLLALGWGLLGCCAGAVWQDRQAGVVSGP